VAREDERLYEALAEAIADQRLGPGTRLAEVEVAETYGSTRRHVERALLRLETDGLVTRRRHAGVTVATPSTEEARALFRTRRMVEGAVVRDLAADATRATLMPLRINLRAEADARDLGQTREAVRLSGAFHVLLAQATGSIEVALLVRRLVVRSALVTHLYGNREALACWNDDHGRLLDLLAAGEADAAAMLMQHHLAHVEQALRLPGGAGRRDLKSVLAA
jgi:DNA-binding GntR family transcriptional regulator